MGYEIFTSERGSFLLSTENDLVSDSIKAGRFWEEELEPIFNRVTKDMVVVEVGSYVGDHTVDLSRRCNWVHAFEGKRSTYYQLCANLLLNSCPNVTPYNLCMGEINKRVVGRSPDPNNIAAFLFKESDTGNVIVNTLDDVLADLIRFDFLKVDVEGMDLEVLLGARNLITKFRPIIVYEYNWNISKYRHSDYELYLDSFGYVTKKLDGNWNWLAEYVPV